MTFNMKDVQYYKGEPADGYEHQLVFLNGKVDSPAGNVVLSWNRNGKAALEVEVNHEIARDRCDPAEDLRDALQGLSSAADVCISHAGIKICNLDLTKVTGRRALTGALASLVENKYIAADLPARMTSITAQDVSGNISPSAIQALRRLMPTQAEARHALP